MKSIFLSFLVIGIFSQKNMSGQVPPVIEGVKAKIVVAQPAEKGLVDDNVHPDSIRLGLDKRDNIRAVQSMKVYQELSEHAQKGLIGNIFSYINSKRELNAKNISVTNITNDRDSIDAGVANCPAVLSVAYIYYPLSSGNDHQSSFSIIFYLVNSHRRYRIVDKRIMFHVLGRFRGWCNIPGADYAFQ